MSQADFCFIKLKHKLFKLKLWARAPPLAVGKCSSVERTGDRFQRPQALFVRSQAWRLAGLACPTGPWRDVVFRACCADESVSVAITISASATVRRASLLSSHCYALTQACVLWQVLA